MSRARDERGIALVTTIILTAVMLVMGAAILGIVVTQANQTTQERTGESAFNLAEATLNAEAFLLGRSWPQTVAHTPAGNATVCNSAAQTMTGTLVEPAATTTLSQQVQSVLAQTYTGSANPSASNWWVNACQENGRNAWDASLLNGLAYDPSVAADPTPQPRRMWVRAEAEVNGRNRAVVGLVQAGQQPVFPANLAVVAGKMGADLGTSINSVTNGGLVGPLGNLLLQNDPMIVGNVGLRCSLLDTSALRNVTDGCVSGVLKATSLTTLSSLLQSNDYSHFGSANTVSEEQVGLLRQQAKLTGSYVDNVTSSVADGANCYSGNMAGKIVFIEQVGDGTGSCKIPTAGGATAAAVIVGSGGIRVQGGGTFTGVLYALHRKALTFADIRIENGSKVVGGVFVDDNNDLAAGSRRGQVEVIPPTLTLSTLVNSLAVCQPILFLQPCAVLVALLGTNVDGALALLSNLGGLTPLATAITTQLNSSLPAITFSESVVESVTTFGDSAVVAGTFREVQPSH